MASVGSGTRSTGADQCPRANRLPAFSCKRAISSDRHREGDEKAPDRQGLPGMELVGLEPTTPGCNPAGPTRSGAVPGGTRLITARSRSGPIGSDLAGLGWIREKLPVSRGATCTVGRPGPTNRSISASDDPGPGQGSRTKPGPLPRRTVRSTTRQGSRRRADRRRERSRGRDRMGRAK